MAGITIVLELIKIPLDIIQTAVFQLFIYEEALQTTGFGVYTAMQAKDWDEADRQIKNMELIYKNAVWAHGVATTVIRTTLGTIMLVAGELAIKQIWGVSVVSEIEGFFLNSFTAFFSSIGENIITYKAAIVAGRAKEASTTSLEKGAPIW